MQSGYLKGPYTGYNIGRQRQGYYLVDQYGNYYSTGTAETTFECPFTAGGIAGLAAAGLSGDLTINGITVSPTVKYEGKNATTSLWTATVGDNLPIVSSGGAVTPGKPVPWHTTEDLCLKFNAGDFYKAAAATTCDLTTGDIVAHIILSCGEITGGFKYIASKWDGVNPPGWNFWVDSSNVFVFMFNSGAGYKYINACTMMVGAEYDFWFFADRSGSAVMYCNATAGTPVNISGSSASLTNSTSLALGAFPGALFKSNETLALFELWTHDAWLDTHLQATIAQKSLYTLTGCYATTAAGNEYPTVQTRASAKTIHLISSGKEQLHFIGAGWPSVCEDLDGSSTIETFCGEPAAQNSCLQSQTFGTTWTKVEAGDTITSDNAVAPNGRLTADKVAASAANDSHGVTQDITLTATVYTFSVYAKASTNKIALVNTTVANCTADFNTSTGVASNVGAGVIRTSSVLCAEDYYRCEISFMGTDAAHTFQCLVLDASGNHSYGGSGEYAYLWGAQCEIGDCASSYIQTAAAPVSRVAEVLRFSGTDNIPAPPFRITFDLKFPDVDQTIAGNGVLSLNDGGSANDRIDIGIDHDLSSDYLNLYISAGGVEQCDANTDIDITDGEVHSVCLEVRTDSATLSVDGTSFAAAAGITIPDDLDRIVVGNTYAENNLAGAVITNLLIENL